MAPTPKPKPIDPETGTTETAAEKKARLAREAKSRAAKNKASEKNDIYFTYNGTWIIHSRSNRFPARTYGQVMGDEKYEYLWKQAVAKKEIQDKKKQASKNIREKKSNIKTDYIDKYNTYMNAVKIYKNPNTPGTITPKQMVQIKKDFNEARQLYIKTFGIDPASPNVDPKKPEKDPEYLSPEAKAKQDSLQNTKTITTGGDVSSLNISLITDSTGQTLYHWNGNKVKTPIALIGDTNGKYVGSGITGASEDALQPGSPVGFEAYADRIVERYSARAGGIAELKQMLYNKNAYGSDTAAGKSLRYGDEIDPLFRQALNKALLSASNANYRRLIQNKNKSNVTFIDFDSYLKTGGKLPMEAAIGDGANGTIVSRQTFRPEEYEIAVDQLFQSTIGRGATEQELNEFLGKLRSYESANPQTTVVTGSETGAETTTQSGGVDEGVVAALGREQALSAPDAEKNAYDKYFNYVMQAMDTGIELGQ